jgi:hypothetical protein
MINAQLLSLIIMALAPLLFTALVVVPAVVLAIALAIALTVVVGRTFSFELGPKINNVW